MLAAMSAIGDGGWSRELVASTSGKRVPVSGKRVVVLRGVSDDEHGRVGTASFHLFPRQASFRATAPIIPPWVRGTLDGFLPILSPSPQVGRHSVGRNLADHLLHLLILPLFVTGSTVRKRSSSLRLFRRAASSLRRQLRMIWVAEVRLAELLQLVNDILGSGGEFIFTFINVGLFLQ